MNHFKTWHTCSQKKNTVCMTTIRHTRRENSVTYIFFYFLRLPHTKPVVFPSVVVRQYRANSRGCDTHAAVSLADNELEYDIANETCRAKNNIIKNCVFFVKWMTMAVVLCVLLCAIGALGFNVDVPSRVVYTGNHKSMFGFTVQSHVESGRTTWVPIFIF